MLAYYMQVLEKISRADARIFRKELRKAFRHLAPSDRNLLKEWYRTACVCRPRTGTMQQVPVASSTKRK